MTHHDKFHRLADAYPANSLWELPGKPGTWEWWELAGAALEMGCLSRFGPDEAGYWEAAYGALETFDGVAVSAELEMELLR